MSFSLYASFVILTLGMWLRGPDVPIANAMLLDEQIEIEETFDVNHFRSAHQISKPESVQILTGQRLQSEKPLRDCMFDYESIRVLTDNLFFFVKSIYTYRLPPLWRPSIAIAQRRLII